MLLGVRAQRDILGWMGGMLLAQRGNTKEGTVREIEHWHFLPVHCTGTFDFFWYKAKFYQLVKNSICWCSGTSAMVQWYKNDIQYQRLH